MEKSGPQAAGFHSPRRSAKTIRQNRNVPLVHTDTLPSHGPDVQASLCAAHHQLPVIGDSNVHFADILPGPNGATRLPLSCFCLDYPTDITVKKIYQREGNEKRRKE
jgi:hypothetical protein